MAGAGEIKAGGAYVEIYTKDNKLSRGLKAASAKLKAFGVGMSQVGSSLLRASAVVVTPLVAAAKVFASMGDEVEKMSRKTGISAEALSEIGFAAEQSGADLATFEKGIKGMQRVINDAERGLSTAKDAFRDLGLDFVDLKGLSPEKQFKFIADRLSQIEDPTKRAAVSLMIFGRAGQALLPLMEDGAKGIEMLQEEARRLGLTISTKDAKAAAEFTDQLNRLWRVVKTGIFAVGAALVPVLTDAAKWMMDVVAQAREWIQNNGDLIRTILKVAAIVGIVGAALLVLGKVLTGVAAAMYVASVASGVLGAAFTFLAAHPIVAVFIAIAAAAVAAGVAIRVLTYDTAKLSNEAANLAGENERLRKSELEGVDRLRALAEKQRLTSAQMDEAEGIIKKLEEHYGDLGIEIDRAAGKLVGFADAQDKVTRAMREQVESEIKAQIAEHQANVDELIAEMQSVRGWSQEADEAKIDALTAQASAQNKHISALVAKLKALRAGEKTALVGEEHKPGADVDASGIVAGLGRQEKAEAAARLIEGINQRIHELKLGQIEDEERRALQAVQAEYNERLKEAVRVGAEVSKVEEAYATERSAIRDKFAKQREKDAEEEAKRKKDIDLAISDEIARLEIENTMKGLNKELALIELARKQELRDALESGASADLINKRADLLRQRATLDLANEPIASVRGTFNAAALQGLQGAGSGPEEETAKNTAATAAKLAEIDRNLKLGQLVFTA